MAKSAGSVIIDLLLNDARFVEGTKKAKSSLDKFANQAVQAGKTAALGIAAATLAVTALTLKQAALIDATNKAARALGIQTESFQALSLLAEEAGVSQESLTNLIGKSQRSIVEAASGVQTYTEAFDRLNLKTKDLINLSPDKQFEAIAISLSEIENPTLRNATAMDIFGRSGRDVVNMLEDFSAKAQEARDFNDKFNISISAIDGRVIEEANDTFARLGKAVSGLGNTIAVELAPLITAASNALLNAGINGETFGKLVSGAMSIAARTIDVVRTATLGLEAIFIKVSQVLNGLIIKYLEFEAAVSKLQDRFSKDQKFKLGAAIDQENLANAKVEAAKLEQAYINLEKRAGEYQTTAEKIAKIQEDARTRAANAPQIGPVSVVDIDAIGGSLQKVDEKFVKTAESANIFGKNIEEFGKKAAQSVQQSFADFLFDPFENGVKGMVKGFVDSLRRMVAEAAAARLAEALFGNGEKDSKGLLSGLGGIFGGGKPDVSFSLPFFADGGYLAPGQFGIAGEKGAELIYGGKTGVSVFNQEQMGGRGGNTYQIDARGTDSSVVLRLEQALLALAGPGVIERRVVDAQSRGAL